MTKASDFSVQTPANPDAPLLPWVNALAFSTRDGELLELVQLSTVLNWLMQSKRQHFFPAVLTLHDALAGFDGLAMYAVTKSGLARAVGDSDAFGLDSPQQGRRVISRGIGEDYCRPPKPRTPLPDGVTSGISAALYVVRRECDLAGAADSFMAPNSALSCLAVSCKQAAALWGAGASVEAETVTAQAAVKPPKILVKDMAPEWDGKRLFEDQKEIRRSGAKNFTKQLEILSGLNGTEIRRRIKAHKKPTKNMFSQLVNVAGRG